MAGVVGYGGMTMVLALAPEEDEGRPTGPGVGGLVVFGIEEEEGNEEGGKDCAANDVDDDDEEVKKA